MCINVFRKKENAQLNVKYNENDIYNASPSFS